MEFLRRLHECNEQLLSFRQAFLSLGMVNDSKPLKQLNDEETNTRKLLGSSLDRRRKGTH